MANKKKQQQLLLVTVTILKLLTGEVILSTIFVCFQSLRI